MKIGYVQFRPVFGRKEENLDRLGKLIKEGSDRGAELLVLPELCSSGYVFKSREEVKALSERVPKGLTTETLADLAKALRIHIVAGLCEEKDGMLYNSAVLVGHDGFIDVYRKTHLFNEEKFWFSPGDGPFRVYDISSARIGMMICFDWFFPEVIRILALKTAQIVCHPSNLVLPYCQTALLGAAIQNKIFIITANRTGVERGTRFTGMSQVVDPNMEILARSKRNCEEVGVVKINPEEADYKRITRNNDAWADRKPYLYGSLVEPKK